LSKIHIAKLYRIIFLICSALKKERHMDRQKSVWW